MSFIHNYKNARAVVEQIKRGEWLPRYNPLVNDFLTAEKDGDELWLANGSFFCDVNGENSFGYIFRHYVYYAGSSKLRSEALKSRKKKTRIKLY